MKPIEHIHQQLRSQQDPSVDQAMAAALATADPLEARFIALTLLERGHPQGTLGVIQAFHILPQDIQQTVVALAGELYRPLREAAAGKSMQGVANAIEIIARSRRPRLAYLASERLSHGPAPLRGPAAACLLYMSRYAATDVAGNLPPQVDAETTEFLLKAVQDAVGTYGTHFQQPVLIAMAALSPRPMPASLRVFNDWHHPVVEPMRRLLERPPEACVRRLLLVAGRMPTLMNAVLAGIHSSLQVNKLGDVLESAHMLLVGAMHKNILRLSDPDRYWPQPQQILQMPAHQSRFLARWAMALPLEPSERVVRLSMLNRSGDPPTRLAALRQLLTMGNDPQAEVWGVHAAVCSYTGDTDPAIARIALRHLIRCKWKDLAQLLLRLVNSGHPQVQQLASHYLSNVGFDRLWNAWPRLDVNQQLSAGKAMIKIDAYFHRHLGQKLTYMDRPTRLRALSIIHVLNQGPMFEPALIALSKDKDEMVASAAVRTLGSTPSPQTIQTLHNALDHQDSRVRANAIEALQQADSRQHVTKLVKMARQEEARPRANAINALLDIKSAEAMSSLADMLNHRESEHRASALWLVDRLGLITLARQVAEMSLDDRDPQVRVEAQKVVQRLIESMNALKSAASGSDPAGKAQGGDASSKPAGSGVVKPLDPRQGTAAQLKPPAASGARP